MTDQQLMTQALDAMHFLLWESYHHGILADPKHPMRQAINELEKSHDALRERLADNTIHSCSYYCERPECVKEQRDELRQLLAGGKK